MGNNSRPFVALDNRDCLMAMRDIADETIDLAILDLPYGVTDADWDRRIDAKRLWAELRRVITIRGTVLAFATQPFASYLVAPALDILKYDLIWQKTKPTGHLHIKNRPMAAHENILVFSRGMAIHDHASPRRMTFHHDGRLGEEVEVKRPTSAIYKPYRNQRVGEPYRPVRDASTSILRFGKDPHDGHPSRKPLALIEWLIRAYSNPDDLILDPTMGSGTTVVAAINTGRDAIGIERCPKFFAAAQARIAAASSLDRAA